MIKNLQYLLMFALGVMMGYQTFLKYYPNILYFGVKKKIANTENNFGFAQLPDAESQFVVKPNPDFLYSTCHYNLEDGPLRLTGDLPDSSYWSIAFYEPNTVNFYVKNDMEFHSDQLDMIITTDGKNLPKNAEDFEIVKSPHQKGLILFRLLITDKGKENVEKFKKIQESVKVERLE